MLERALVHVVAPSQSLIEDWHVEYNTDRPHSALGYLTPEQFAQAHTQRKLLTLDSI